MNHTELCKESYSQAIIIKDVEIMAEVKHQRQMLKKKNRRFISWELRIHDNDRIQLVIIHNDGFYTIAI